MTIGFPRLSPGLTALFSDIRQALADLVEQGTEAVFDLGSAALCDHEYSGLDAILGTGEVTARVEASGPVEVRETAFAGVWRIDHLGPSGIPQARFVEITLFPSLLRTPAEDAARALCALDLRLAGAAT